MENYIPNNKPLFKDFKAWQILIPINKPLLKHLKDLEKLFS